MDVGSLRREIRHNLVSRDVQKVNAKSKVDTTMYWLQPGNQRVGDQQFNAFSHKKVEHTYITSWKTEQGRDQLSLHYASLILVFALFFSVVGFILQFIGLRGLHGSVALYQIAATLLMSIVRALLRLRRLDPNDNNLRSLGAKIEGHELDWQAMDIFLDHWGLRSELTKDGEFDGATSNLRGLCLPSQIKGVKSWLVYDERSWAPSKCFHSNQDSVEQMMSESRHGDLGLFGFRSTGNGTSSADRETWLANLGCVSEAVHVARRYEGDYQEGSAKYLGPNPVAMIALLRSRLAYLTGDGIVGVQPRWDGPARSVAQELQIAMQGLANYVFSGHMALKENWQDIMALTWNTTAVIEYTTDGQDTTPLGPLGISFPMFRYGREWKISKHRLEAVISLWASSLDRVDVFDDLSDKVLLVRSMEEQSIYSTLKLWMPAGNLNLLLVDDGPPTWTEAWLVQGRRLLRREQVERNGELVYEWLISMRAKSSKIKLLAQNLFTIFISRLADIINTIDTPDEDLFSAWESQTIRSSESFYGLSNTHVKSITRLFVQSGLGTEEEALMCVIPVFVQAGVLPQEDIVMDKLLKLARKLRRGKMYQRAEVILKIMLGNPNPKTRQTALREIGEVYRKAYRAYLEDPVSVKYKRISVDGLKQMALFRELIIDSEDQFHIMDSALEVTLKGWPKPYRPTEKELMIFEKYRHLAESLEHSQPGLRRSDLENHLKSPLYSTEDLTVAMRVELSSLNENKAGDLLLLSIRNSCPELVDDLLEINKGLIDKLILSDWTLDEAMKPTVDILVMETILDLGEIRLDLPCSKKTDDTALSLAISERRTDIVRLLLNRGAPVNALTPAGGAIFCCVADKDGKALSAEDTQELMTLLLDKGAKVNAERDDGTVVKRACVVGNHRAVRMLVERRAHLSNQMLLHEVSGMGDTAILNTLLEPGLDSEINKPASNDVAPHPVHFVIDPPPPRELALLSSVVSTDGTSLNTRSR